MNKSAIIQALQAFINQRPGIDPHNYGNWRDYRNESASVTRDLSHARTLLNAIAWRDSITANRIINAAMSGRLSISSTDSGALSVDYCVGQYWPTEYRRAVASLCARVLWNYWRDECAPSPRPENMGDYLRSKARDEFGRAIASRFFN